MTFYQRAKRAAGRAFRVLLRVLYVALKAFFVVLMLVIPIPIFFKPEITNPYKRNQIAQVEKKK